MEATKKVETEIAEKVIQKSREDPQPQPVVEKKKKNCGIYSIKVLIDFLLKRKIK